MTNTQKQNNGIYQLEGDFYVKLPNDIVLGLEDNMSLRKKLNCSFLCATLFKLYEGTNMRNITSFSIEELMESCGYTSDKRMIKKFKELLLQLNKLNVISNLSKDIIKAKADTYIKCRLNLKLDSQYFMIYAQQFEGIFNSDYDVKLKNNAFTFLCYVLSKIKINGGFCYFSLTEVSEALGISIPTILSVRDILKELKLLYFDFVGTQYHNRNCGTIYAISKEELFKGLQWSYKQYSYLSAFKPKEEYKRLFESLNKFTENLKNFYKKY